MLSSFNRLSLLSLLALWLACTINWANAAPNFISHCYEKLYLWEMYNVACDVQTPAKQDLILPFSKQKGQEASNNKGRVNTDQRLTYNEFMTRVNAEPLPASYALTEPGDLQTSAQELMDNKLGQGLDTNNVNKAKLLKVKKGAYAVLFQECNKKLTEWRTDGKNGDKVSPRMDNLKTISDRIVIARREDSLNYLISLFQKATNKGGLGLGDDGAVVKETRPSQLPGKDTYETVDFDATFNNNQEKLKNAGFNSRDDLSKWVDSVIAGETKDAASQSHAQATSVWQDVNYKNTLSNDALKNAGSSCAR